MPRGRPQLAPGHHGGITVQNERRGQLTEYRPTRWWRILDEDGSLWCETSNPDEARAAFYDRSAGRLQRLFTREESEWRDVSDA